MKFVTNRMNGVFELGKIDTCCDRIQKPIKMKAHSTLLEEETITYQRSFKDVGERVSLDEVKKKRKRTCGQSCFLCGRAGFSGDESTSVGRMYKMFRTEYSKHDSEELFANLAVFYKEEIYELYVEQGMDAPLLTADQIKHHFLDHNLEPTTYLSEEIRSLREVSDVLKTNLFERDVQGHVDVCEKKLKNLLSVQQQIMTLYNSDVSRMNFFNSSTSVVGVNNKKKK